MLVPSSQLHYTHKRNYGDEPIVITLVEVMFFSYWNEERKVSDSFTKKQLFLFFRKKVVPL